MASQVDGMGDNELVIRENDFSQLAGGPFERITCFECDKLPDNFGNNQQMQQLTKGLVLYCCELTALPDSIGKLSQLQHLDLNYCQQLRAVPDSIGKLSQLQHLDLCNCTDLTALSDSMGQLTALQELFLRWCASLSSLPDSLCQLSGLSSLSLEGCSGLSSIPDGVGQLSRLLSLSLEGCSGLSSIPDGVSQLSGLTSLSLQGCSALSSIPDGVGQLAGLKRLLLDGLLLPSSLDSMMQLKSLTQLSVGGWCRLVELPDKIGQLTRLKELSLQRCSKLSTLPAGLSQLTALTLLDCNGCSQLSILPDGVGQLLALEVLDLGHCAVGDKALVIIVQCTSLTQVRLSGCNSLSRPRLDSDRAGLWKLQELDLSLCSELSSVEWTLPHLTAIISLSLSGCSSLTSLPELNRNIGLMQLDLSGCSSLVRVPETLGELSELTQLDLSGCHQITALPVHMNMPSLRRLSLQSCYSLQALPRAMGNRLETLELSYCSEVDSLAESLVGLEATLVEAGTFVRLQGWGNLADGSTELRRLMHEGGLNLGVDGAALLLRRATIIQRLLGDQATVLELLSRLSWLGVLLAATTFTAALAPPGGYNNGLLFLSYSAADCRGTNQLAAHSATVQCITAGSRQNCTISDADPGGCVVKPDECTSIEGASCSVQPSQPLLLWFFVFDLLSFGFSMVLVMFVVACSIPRTGRSERRVAAGAIWLSLVIASSLLILAVGCGMLSLLCGLLAVYPLALRSWVLVPWCLSCFCMLLMFLLLWARWRAVYPGAEAVRAAVSSMLQQFAALF